MVMLVTLQQASDHLRRDTTVDNADLTLKIHAASAAVLNYIRNGADPFTDSAGEPILDSAGEPIGIPYDVMAAVLLLLAEFYTYRAAGDVPGWEHGYLPTAVVSLLYPYRDPSLA